MSQLHAGLLDAMSQAIGDELLRTTEREFIREKVWLVIEERRPFLTAAMKSRQLTLPERLKGMDLSPDVIGRVQSIAE